MRLWPSPAIGSLSIWHDSTLDAVVVDQVMDPCRCAVKHWGAESAARDRRYGQQRWTG